MALPTEIARPRTQHPHHPNGLDTEDLCPLCGSKLTAAMHATIATRQRSYAEGIERTIKERFERQAKAEVAKAVGEATRTAEAKLKAIRDNQQGTIAARVKKEQEAAAKRVAEAVNAERTKGLAERLKLTEQLGGLRRRLERQDRPAGAIGEEGELDAFALLTDKFTPEGDEITRTKKFTRGGDIEHRIANGSGLILYEIKNHQTYQSKWSIRAKENQQLAQADHVVIVTSAFPANHRELMLADNGVLVVSPSRLPAVATWLRTHTIRSYTLKLSNQHRKDKSARLYSFMTSARVADRWDRMARTVKRMHESLRAERAAHDRAWSDRTDQLDVLTTIRNDFIQDLDAI